MKTNLIIVEGLPGSGKSTTAAMIAEVLKEKKKKVCCFDEGVQEHPADYADYDFPDFETEREKILEKWHSFVENAGKDNIYVFNCIFLQNPMCETMMRFGMPEEASLEYIAEIAKIIRPLNPVIIYIDQPDVKKTVDSVLDERGNGWLNAVIDYHTSQGYGKQNGLSGYEGYLRCLEERKKRELRILQALSVDHYTIGQDMTVEELESLYVSAGRNCPAREQMECALDHSTKTFVVRYKGEAVAAISLLGDYGIHWFMKDLIVSRDLQGQMAGTLLYRFSENYIKSTLKEHRKTSIRLRASEEEKPFYRSLGFQTMPGDETGSEMEKILER